jgi:hypothetical protein
MSVLPLVPPADRSAPGWHVSPVIDVLAYHFSWLLVLIPMALAGNHHPDDYFVVWVIGSTLSFSHRHFTMPYVYLDGSVFKQHILRFVAFPVLLTAAFLATPTLNRWRVPSHWLGVPDILLVCASIALYGLAWWEDRRGHKYSWASIGAFSVVPLVMIVAWLSRAWTSNHLAVTLLLGLSIAITAAIAGVDAAGSLEDRPLLRSVWLPALAAGLALLALVTTSVPGSWPAQATRFNPVISAIAAFAAAWNIWHVYMQKFGILRMYAAKQVDVAPERRTPAWVDRWVVFGWVPFYFVFLAPGAKQLIKEQAPTVLGIITPIADTLIAAGPYLLLPSLACLFGSLGAFLYYEHRSTGLRSMPRLWAFIGLTALGASFLVVSPLKAYIAYGFSHAIEYMVFVWAFQRRRYATPQPNQSALAWLVQRPALLYVPLCGLLFGAVLYLDFWEDFFGPKAEPHFFGVSGDALLFYWTIWHSMAHFYYDSFLWKMRMPSVRASL